MATEPGSTEKRNRGEGRDQVLLVVDEDPRMCEAVIRVLTGWFDRAYAATNVVAASRILSADQVTHLLCDQFLDLDNALGTDVAPVWRRENGCLERVVIYTGAVLDEDNIPREIDAVLAKGGTSIDVLRSLGILERGDDGE